MPTEQWITTPHDCDILRRLAAQVREIADNPLNLDRKRLWLQHDAGHAERPMILAEAWVAYKDLPDSSLECVEPWARGIEDKLRFTIYEFQTLRDDHVVEPYVQLNWRVNPSDYGVQSKTHYAERVSGNVSSRQWEPPLQNLSSDLAKLKPRVFSVDRETTLASKQHLESVFDGILPVRIRGGFYWTLGMTITVIDLIGLENYMTYMCTEPEGLHQLMAFLRDDHLAFVDWLEKENLFTLNNENDYIGSGSMGYTHDLPMPGYVPGGLVRSTDLWCLSESQETALVSPDMFDEFVFQYQLPIMQRFGKVYYGCCEAVHQRWHILERIPNLARVSVSPWCDQAFMADAMAGRCVFSRKPNPTLISTGYFDEDAIRDDLRTTIQTAHNCALEIIMKDVHTLAGDPSRIARWVELAFQTLDE